MAGQKFTLIYLFAIDYRLKKRKKIEGETFDATKNHPINILFGFFFVIHSFGDIYYG